MNDDDTERVIQAVLNLAVVLRDEIGDGVTDAARAVLHLTAGDAVAALSVAAALIRVDEPVDAWWSSFTGEHPIEPRRVAACGTHAAFNRHRANGEPVDTACTLAERTYQRERKRTRKRSSGVPQPGHLRNKETAA